MTPPPRKRPRRVSARVSPSSTARPSLLGACETVRVERRTQAADRQWLVEPEPEHHTLARSKVGVERLELALGERPAASASR